MSKNPPDWWARIIGGFGLLIAVSGLVLTYVNYRWQKNVYEKSQEERVFVQLSAAYNLSSLLRSRKTKEQPSQGQLAVEVVNLGMQPMYLKSITGEVGGRRASFYEHDPLNAKEPMRRLEPGEAADYKIDWESSVEKMAGKGIVDVETTKKRFSQPAQINKVTVSDFVTLLELAPGKLVARPHPSYK